MIRKHKSRAGKIIIMLSGLVIFCLFSYWCKNFLSINFIDNFSLSNIFPFNYLQRDNIVLAPKPGIILYDSFNSRNIKRKWLYLWAVEKQKVNFSYDINSNDNSKCICIKSNSNKSWSYSHNQFIEVLINDRFKYKANIKINGEKNTAFVGIDVFNKKKEVVQWNYTTTEIRLKNEWVPIEKTFIINDNIKYIRFRLSGNGKGNFWFDDIIFKKLPNENY